MRVSDSFNAKQRSKGSCSSTLSSIPALFGVQAVPDTNSRALNQLGQDHGTTPNCLSSVWSSVREVPLTPKTIKRPPRIGIPRPRKP